MEIKEFVKQALVQIKEATSEVSTNDDKFYLDVDNSKGVHFDLAVITTQEAGADGGAKIQIAGLVSVGGGATLADKYEQTSRVEFNVKHRDLAHERKQDAQVRALNSRLDKGEAY